MSQADLVKWDARYREGAYADRPHATALLERYCASFRGPVLDVAAGAGRNALFLAARGFEVDAVDISSAALARLRTDAAARGLQVTTFAADLEQGIPPDLRLRDRYGLILLVRYVNMTLVPQLLSLLADGGAFVCEQHLQTDRDVIGPRTPAFRLAPGALLEACRGQHVCYYREGLVTDPDGRQAALAQIIATRGPAVLHA